MNETISIGFAITGSFCTFAKTLTLLSELVKQGYEVQPIFSNHTSHLDNRFTAAETFCKKVEIPEYIQFKTQSQSGQKPLLTHWSSPHVPATQWQN